MKTIWKYELAITDDQYVDMPIGAKPLSVDIQNGVPCMWVEVDSEKTPAQVHIMTVGTGYPVSHPKTSRFIGTYQLHGGSFVGHVYVVSS